MDIPLSEGRKLSLMVSRILSSSSYRALQKHWRLSDDTSERGTWLMLDMNALLTLNSGEGVLLS